MLGSVARSTEVPAVALLRILPEIKVVDLIDLVNQAWETDAIAYWVDRVLSFKRQDVQVDGSEPCYEFGLVPEGEPDKAYKVDVNVVKDGIEKILNRKVQVNTYIYSYIWSGVQTGVFDGDACDCIVQAGLFGEIVYG